MIAKNKNIPDGKHDLKLMDTQNLYDLEYFYYPLTTARTPSGEFSVSIGDTVYVGDILGTRKAAFFEQPFYSTVSGKVISIEKHLDQFLKPHDCLKVQSDGLFTKSSKLVERSDEEIKKIPRNELVELTKQIGLIGLGGSAFPSYIKMQTTDQVDIIVANGVECEPLLVSDYLLTKENYEDLFKGLLIAIEACGAKKGIIAIKEKYHELYELLNEKIEPYRKLNLEIKLVGNYYPQGWEVETIKSSIGINVPPGELTSKYGVIDYNVTTLIYLYRGIKYGLPVEERIFSLSGNAITNKLYKVKVGSLLQDIIDKDNPIYSDEQDKLLVLGGPLMGNNINTFDIVVTPTITNLTVSYAEKIIENPCIRCGSCVLSCPASLSPVQIMNAYKSKDKDELIKLKVSKCVECGLCSYVCTSKIHLTEIIRSAKKFIR
ncbi:MAG: RnfABCDGE type electron transport complex subunit C [Acholeplasmatales bacterium]|jgi:electron transport complex protein RnfC|nr:RnfABCDGE type electron transport complex subunit C [Acholeplasmatales bacterium]